MINKIEKILNEKYKDCIKSLSKISEGKIKNEDGTETVIKLCDYEDKFFCYDENIVRKKIYRNKNCPKSPDMIIVKDNGITFVEFKAGLGKNIKPDEIKLKGIEGGLIALHKMVEKHLSFEDVFKVNKSYIIVYNEELNPRNERTGGIESHLAQLESELSGYVGRFFSSVTITSNDVFIEMMKEQNLIKAG